METWALRPASDLARSLLRHCIDKENLPPNILRTREPPLVISTPLVHPPATNRVRTVRKDISGMETPIATVGQAYDGRPVVPRCRLLRFLFGGVGLGLHLHSLPLGCGCLINARLSPSLAFCIIYYNYTTRRARVGGNVGARVEGRDRGAIGKEETCSGCKVSLTTRTGSSPTLCRSVSSRSPGGERGHGLCHVSTFYTTLVKKSQEANGASELPRTPPTHSGEEGSSVSLVHAHEVVRGWRSKLRVVG
jgi:hypothetical protein